MRRIYISRCTLGFLQVREVFVRVRHGFSYLLRLINANVYNCPILLSAHGHSLQVLAADGNPVQSMTGTHVVLFPGRFYILCCSPTLYPNVLHNMVSSRYGNDPCFFINIMQNCIALEFNKF